MHYHNKQKSDETKPWRTPVLTSNQSDDVPEDKDLLNNSSTFSKYSLLISQLCGNALYVRLNTTLPRNVLGTASKETSFQLSHLIKSPIVSTLKIIAFFQSSGTSEAAWSTPSVRPRVGSSTDAFLALEFLASLYHMLTFSRLQPLYIWLASPSI